MSVSNYLYLFRYQPTESELCNVEIKSVFDQETDGKLLLSDLKIEPDDSAFIKRRIDILLHSTDYDTLIQQIKKEGIHSEGFKVEYLVLDGDPSEYPERLSRLKDIGYSIEGTPDYRNPTITYVLCQHAGIWYFGVLIKNSNSWYDLKKKPKSYSNSININTAKSLVNIAAKGNKTNKLLDACCGVGTIMLQACYSGYEIEGSDINWKICQDARENLAHFKYTAPVYHSDVSDLTNRYAAAIIDLPYNLLSHASDEDVLHIIGAVGKLTGRLVIVSIADIEPLIQQIGFSVLDQCSVGKRGKTNFARRVWVCEKQLAKVD